MTHVLIKTASLDPDNHTGRMPYKDEVRDQSDATTSQATPRLPANHQKRGERHGTASSSSPKKIS